MSSALDSQAIDPRAYAWPTPDFDPVAKMRLLAAARPHTAYREIVFEADFDRVWDFVSDLEANTSKYEFIVSRVRILERRGDTLRLESRTPPGFWQPMDVVLRPGFCLMESRLGEVGMAARAESATRTRFVHFERAKVGSRFFRPLFQLNIRHDFRRLREIFADDERGGSA